MNNPAPLLQMFTIPPPGYQQPILRSTAKKIGVVFTYGSIEPADRPNVIGMPTNINKHFNHLFFGTAYLN